MINKQQFKEEVKYFKDDDQMLNVLRGAVLPNNTDTYPMGEFDDDLK